MGRERWTPQEKPEEVNRVIIDWRFVPNLNRRLRLSR